MVYGPNEFGKTTLLEFVRRILFGFPSRRTRVNPYTPVAGGEVSGRLGCESASGEGFVISRVQGPYNGRITVSTGNNEILDQHALDAFLGHASKDIFQNVYAFTIDELQSFQTLKGDEIKNRIYGAGLGLGNVSLVQVEKDIEDRCVELFKPRGSSKMSNILKDIKELEAQVRDIQGGLALYDELTLNLNRLEENKTVLQKQVEEISSERRGLEPRRDLYPMVVEFLSSQTELEGLPDLDAFPENALQNMIARKSEIRTLSDRLLEERNGLKSLKTRLGNISFNQALLDHESDVLYLQQSVQEIRSANRDIERVQYERDYLAEQIQIEIREIDPDWDENRILDFELTEGEKYQIHTFYETLDTARQEVSRAKDKLDFHREHKATEESKGWNIPDWLKYFTYGMLALGLAGVVSGWTLSMSRLLEIKNGGFLGDILLLVVSFGVMGLGLALAKKLWQGKDDFIKEDKLDIELMAKLESAKREQDRVFEEWRCWLKDRNMDVRLAPLNTESMGNNIRKIKGMIAERIRLEERLETIDKTIRAMEVLVHKIQPALTNFTLNKDIPVNMEIIARLFEESKKERGKKVHLEEQCREQEDKLEKLEKLLQEKQESIQQIIESAGAADEDDFQLRHGIFDKRKSLIKLIEEKRGFIQSRVGIGEPFERFIESVQSTTPEIIDHELNLVSNRLEGLSKERDKLIEELGETKNRIDQLSGNDDLLARQSELEIKKQALRDYALKWAVHKSALFMLEEAKQKYERERQPEVIRSAAGIFQKITAGKYKSIIKPLDSEEILIDNDAGARKGVLEMSRGTREQLYLAMRFGLIEEYEARSEPLPVIMDDVFVNFDDVRGELVREILSGFSSLRQVIVLTCHERVRDAYIERGARSVVF